MRLIPRSAAYRIGFLSALAFSLATLAIGLAVLYAVHSAFQHQLDETIEQTSSSLLAEYADEGSDGVIRAIVEQERHGSNDLALALLSSDGSRIAGSFDTSMPSSGWHQIDYRAADGDVEPARALVTALPDGTRLVVVADYEPVEEMVQTILAMFSLGFVAMLMIGALIALFLGRYLERRLDAIAMGTRAFAAGDYSGRAQVGTRNDEFDRLALSINAMLDRIEALLRNLRQVTSDLAHDMRTPLTHLRSQLETMLIAPAGEQTERTESAIEKCDETLRIFAAILRISELEGGELRRHFRPVDLDALARDIVEAHEPLAEESGHKLVLVTTDSGISVSGDRELLAQALINLVENALRHTPSGSRIVVGASLIDGSSCLFVRDNGPGIPKAERERATQRFVRLDAARNTPGHGLGLSLVRAVAEAHGGELSLRDAMPGLDARIIFKGEQN